MRKSLLPLILLFWAVAASGQTILLQHPPRHYICYRTTTDINIDGVPDEADWAAVPWTDFFTDIEGDRQPAPHFKTRTKMMWDDNYLYIAAELEEPHIWATYTERESVIFHENDFEVFIDPDGDTHNYFELEVNALGTEWDLLLTKPYRFKGIPFNSWDIAGLKTGIHLDGTLNNPADKDNGWTVELALPWKILKDGTPNESRPAGGDQWRINFSRVQWRLDVVDGKYVKTINPETGNPYPEYNWVWSPQWAINMHKPEYWGYLQFSDKKAGSGTDGFMADPDTKIRILLRELFDRQHQFARKNKRFAASMEELNINDPIFKDFFVTFETTPKQFILSAKSATPGYYWFIASDSRIWKATEYNPAERLPWE